jgi:outer membrane protein OmpA-like peptidoglycan-associated protein
MKVIEKSINTKDYNGAIKIINTNIEYFNNDKRLISLIKILQAPLQNIKSVSISPNINTNNWEYSVTETADGKKLYFCGRNRPENLNQNNEDIFMSVKTNNQWAKPIPVEGLNTPYGHEAPLFVTADGNRLLLYSNSDIYYTDKIKGGWSSKSIFPVINTPDSWEADAMISADGNSILFISDRQGNVGNYQPYGNKFHGTSNGNTDIYVSLKTKTGWSKPINIGKNINTPFSERSPFLHSDLKTLYFSSDGLGGLGKFDVYMTKRLNDTSWTEWSEPVNLGKEINSTKDEYGYKISTTGDYAYFSSFQNDNFDIYTLKLPENMKPETVTIVSGKITDNNDNSLYATIKWENLETGEQIGFSLSDPDNGNFIIILPNGKNYGYFIEKEEYYPSSGNVNLTKITSNNEYQKDIKLFSFSEILTKNVSVPLPNLFFDSNKFTLKKESYPELNRLSEFINSHNDISIEISGHTDNVGAPDYNLKLSQDRASEVKKYLISKDCNADKLIAIGYGHTKPVTSNDTEAGRAENRRVEFKILK